MIGGSVLEAACGAILSASFRVLDVKECKEQATALELREDQEQHGPEKVNALAFGKKLSRPVLKANQG